MKNNIRSPRKEHRKLLYEASKNIVCLEAKINYTTFTLQTGKTQTMSYNLAVYGKILPKTFIRVNRSCIINKSFIKSLDKESKKIILEDGTEFQISRRRWAEVSENVA